MEKRANLIYIVSDTLRADYLGCYGNDFIRTPNLDAFAAESVVFDCAHPESLPTIPFRRALHTGRRAYPFENYDPVRWDNVYLPPLPSWRIALLQHLLLLTLLFQNNPRVHAVWLKVLSVSISL